ncbi:MAG: 5-dehydro-4-deoxy-D-glucuronate isomerase [Gemmatimonadota bacterium]
MRYLPDRSRTARMTTAELRDAFLVADLFRPGEVTLRFIDLDRVVLGGIVPTDAPLTLVATPAMAADHFTDRRELGLLNIGDAGAITVDGTRYAMAHRDLLYVGRGAGDIALASDDGSSPARYYLVSYPSHAEHATAHVARAGAEGEDLGTGEGASRRRLIKYVHPDGIRSGQLVMGITEVQDGSVWNTMPCHTHARRTEVYLYFGVSDEAVVFHLMGEPDETRHLVVRDAQAVLSPGWSVHAGAGTGSYAFCWAMGGENQDFGDMQGVAMADLL